MVKIFEIGNLFQDFEDVALFLVFIVVFEAICYLLVPLFMDMFIFPSLACRIFS